MQFGFSLSNPHGMAIASEDVGFDARHGMPRSGLSRIQHPLPRVAGSDHGACRAEKKIKKNFVQACQA
jgi:hypothetical protein